jgi:hypothetical protein
MKKNILLGAALYLGLSFGQVQTFLDSGPLIPFDEAVDNCSDYLGYENSVSVTDDLSIFNLFGAPEYDVFFRTIDQEDTEFKFYLKFHYRNEALDASGNVQTINYPTDQNFGTQAAGTDRITDLITVTDGIHATLEIISYTSEDWVGVEADGFNVAYTGDCNVTGFSAGTIFRVYIKATLNAGEEFDANSEFMHLQLGNIIVNGYNDEDGVAMDETTFNYSAGYDSALEALLSTNKLEAFNFSFNNPVTNRLDLRADNIISNIELYNVMGQKALSVKLNANNGSVDLSSLSKGVYVMNATINDKVGTYRVLKQ